MNMLHTFSGGDNCDSELKERLIATVKKEVKQLMEEAVTKKYIHEESSSVTSLCGAVEACLSHGLRRRALGLFKTSSTTALIQKIAKTCPEADYVSRRLLEIELANECNTIAGKRSCSSSDSIIKPKLLSKGSSSSVTTINTMSSGTSVSAPVVKYLWIRLALYEKRLSKIIEHLVNNANNYYDRDALVADPDFGSILSSLLVGPCALEFTRAKTADHYWLDPHADELVQRHRISSGNRTPPTCHRPIINFKRSLHTSSEDTSSGSFKASSPASVAKDYVESLHQNSRATLLYGKNNVLVLPKDVSEAMPGYLSLHQTIQSLTIKWTPNQLMNGYNDADGTDKSFYWAYALNINVDEIVYVHCHQNRGEDTGGTIILVGQDGVQRPPIHFPEGGHMQSFLSCLETGLLPHGQLDPPLWSQRGMGKMFNWPKSVRRRILPSVMESADETPIDYVFRVVSKSQHEEFLATHPILELGRTSPRRKHLGSCSTTGSSECSSKSLSLEHSITDPPLIQGSQTASIELVCSTMRRQIISRAFYGWLAYCRHLSTVRTHLSGLVNGRITPDLGVDEEGLTKEIWEAMHTDGVITSDMDVFRLVYFGGVQHEIRKEVWPYLLGHYSFGSTPEERAKHDETCKHYYETTMSEWLAVEAIVRQREKEKTAQAMAKLTAEKNKHAQEAGRRVSRQTEMDADDLDNDVFEDHDFSDISDPGDDYDEEMRIENEENMEMDDLANERDKKSSTTDSGNGEEEVCADIVDTEVGIEAQENEYLQSTELETEAEKQSEQILVEFENIDDMEPLTLQENCFAADSEVEAGLTPDHGGILVLSIKSSPSTSSYETVGNEFADMVDLNAPINIVAETEIQETVEMEEPLEEEEIPQDVEGENQRIIKYHSMGDLRTSIDNTEEGDEELKPTHAVIITEAASLDALQCDDEHTEETSRKTSLMSPMNEDITVVASLDALQEPKSACVSPASSNGGVYSCELLENFGLNLHRIEKDVQRCDRNYWYFANENLDKLRNVISTYVWEHLDVGYMQGMCDLVAPLLVIFDDESLCYSCFCKLMERMIENFPNGGAMDMHFANMRSLIQILDSEMYDLMDSHGDYTHFYFCYRWFLLDFKRELVYDDVFATWEVIWAAKHVASSHFVLFLALALLETYRDIILSNSMDFTDVIKFFNEMAERHNSQSILQLSRSLVLQLQTIIENK
ncbi:small G protein signaling modulator 2-like [Teleopsis dalmanni]|uniref:small G protein signaling modulator 2-like n=1 Tax=Teleopsis dalmanni TaxID=139649 RepID=UPI0018CD95C3|nr:small G protein signaling modulator 2-like [Teleopsis dalmanni]